MPHNRCLLYFHPKSKEKDKEGHRKEEIRGADIGGRDDSGKPIFRLGIRPGCNLGVRHLHHNIGESLAIRSHHLAHRCGGAEDEEGIKASQKEADRKDEVLVFDDQGYRGS